MKKALITLLMLSFVSTVFAQYLRQDLFMKPQDTDSSNTLGGNWNFVLDTTAVLCTVDSNGVVTRYVIEADSSLFKLGSGTDALMDKRSIQSTGNQSTTIGEGASGTANNGNVFGYMANNSGLNGQSLGRSASNTEDEGQAIGSASSNTAINGQAIGAITTNESYSGSALGNGSYNRIDSCTNIAGALIIRKSDATANVNPFLLMSGTETVLTTQNIDLTVVDSFVYTIPIGATFFPDEVGVIVTYVDNVTGQAQISYGESGDLSSLVNNTVTSGLTPKGYRERKENLNKDNGITSYAAHITSAATADSLTARFYFKGLLIEDQ